MLAQVRARFGERVFPLSLPLNAGPGFNQVLDVLRSEVITYDTDRSGKFQEAPATGEWAAKAKQLHAQLIEYIAEFPELERIRFVTSHPKEFTQRLIDTYARVPKLATVPATGPRSEKNTSAKTTAEAVAYSRKS